jgi:hypothetical protein
MRSAVKIQRLGLTQDDSPTRWQATGYVEGVGWLEAWGTSLLDAMNALQALVSANWGTGA